MALDQLSPGFSGTIDRIRIVELMQVACYCNMSCDLAIESGSGNGLTNIRSGRVVHAATDGAAGEDALREILSWSRGSFFLKPGSDEARQSIEKAWEQLLLESLRSRFSMDSDASLPKPGFSGEIEGIDLLDLVQLTVISGIDCALRAEAGEQSGVIFFRNSSVFHAECADKNGEEAFREILLAIGGRFECAPLCGNEPRTIDAPLENLLIDAQRGRDEKQAGIAHGKPEAKTILQKLQNMTVADKLRLALIGNKETRGILMRDSNKMIQLAVVGNPKLSESEVALMAASRYSEEDVLRKIANTREWMRLYQIRVALVTNPKCPVSISTKVIETLGHLEWQRIAGSKSVPAVISQMAKRLMQKAR